MFILPNHASPTRRWLVHLLRASVAGPQIPGEEPREDGIDPAALLDGIRRHRIAGLVHQAFASGHIESPLPASFRGVCREVYFDGIRRNVVSLESVAPMVEHLAAAGIPVAPLRGFALLQGAEPFYADIGTRPLGELDLALPRSEAERAGRILEAHDFLPLGAEPKRAASSRRFHRSVAGIDLTLRLHFGAMADDGPLVGHDGAEHFLKELCTPGSTEKRPRTPSRIGHLISTAAHAARHGFARWIWLADIHRIVSSREGFEESGWDLLERAAGHYRLNCAVFTGLAASRELFGTAVPEPLLRRMAPGRLRRGLLQRSLAGRERGSRSKRQASRLLLGDSWWDVARGAVRHAVPVRSGAAAPGN